MTFIEKRTPVHCGVVTFKFVFPQTNVALKMFSHVIILKIKIKDCYMIKNIGNQKFSQIFNVVDPRSG